MRSSLFLPSQRRIRTSKRTRTFSNSSASFLTRRTRSKPHAASTMGTSETSTRQSNHSPAILSPARSASRRWSSSRLAKGKKLHASRSKSVFSPMSEKKFFVDRKGNTSDALEALTLNDPIALRDNLEHEASSSAEVQRMIGEGRSESAAREESIVGRLSRWPLEALQKLLEQRPADNLAHRARKKREDKDALREQLIEEGRNIKE